MKSALLAGASSTAREIPELDVAAPLSDDALAAGVSAEAQAEVVACLE